MPSFSKRACVSANAFRSLASVHDVGTAATVAMEVNEAWKDDTIIDAARTFDTADPSVFDDDPPRAKSFGR